MLNRVGLRFPYALQVVSLLFILSTIILFARDSFAASANLELDKTKERENVNNLLALVGMTYDEQPGELSVIIDEDEAILAIPRMQNLGIINPDITQKTIRTMPMLYASYIALKYTPEILRTVYRLGNADRLHVVMSLIARNDDGKMVKHEIATFNFSRKIYDTANWYQFGAEKLIKEASDFEFSDWYVQNVESFDDLLT